MSKLRTICFLPLSGFGLLSSAKYRYPPRLPPSGKDKVLLLGSLVHDELSPFYTRPSTSAHVRIPTSSFYFFRFFFTDLGCWFFFLVFKLFLFFFREPYKGLSGRFFLGEASDLSSSSFWFFFSIFLDFFFLISTPDLPPGTLPSREGPHFLARDGLLQLALPPFRNFFFVRQGGGVGGGGCFLVCFWGLGDWSWGLFFWGVEVGMSLTLSCDFFPSLRVSGRASFLNSPLCFFFWS